MMRLLNLNLCSIFVKCRVNKENRAAGILDNHVEGEKYSQHALRKYVRNKSPEIMPNINGFFSDPKYWSITDEIQLFWRYQDTTNDRIAFFWALIEHTNKRTNIYFSQQFMNDLG